MYLPAMARLTVVSCTPTSFATWDMMSGFNSAGPCRKKARCRVTNPRHGAATTDQNGGGACKGRINWRPHAEERPIHTRLPAAKCWGVGSKEGEKNGLFPMLPVISGGILAKELDVGDTVFVPQNIQSFIKLQYGKDIATIFAQGATTLQPTPRVGPDAPLT